MTTRDSDEQQQCWIAGEFVKPGSVISFSITDKVPALLPLWEGQGYAIEINGFRWRGTLVSITKWFDGSFDLEVRLNDRTPVGYGPAAVC